MFLRIAVVAATLNFAVAPALAANSMFDQDFATDAQPALAGHVELGGGRAYLSEQLGFPINVNPSFWYNVFTAAGRVNVPLGGRWNFEFEATGHARWNGAFSGSDFGTYGHLWTMFPAVALGAFGGASSGALGLPVSPLVSASALPFKGETYTAGIEGEVYLGRLTFGGQASASYATTNVNEFLCKCLPSTDLHSWQVRGYVAFYVSPNSKIVGEAKYADFAGLPAGSFIPSQTRQEFKGLFEHRFAGTPVSVWVSGSYATFGKRGGLNPYTGDQWKALVGVRVFMDAPGSTLRRHDREVPFRYDPTQPLWLPVLEEVVG